MQWVDLKLQISFLFLLIHSLLPFNTTQSELLTATLNTLQINKHSETQIWWLHIY
jgi:hypothetical protein